jgi:hypothetical protein
VDDVVCPAMRSLCHARVAVAPLAVLGLAVALAACGGDASPSSASSSGAATTTTTAAGADFTAYRDCLASHGVTLPAGTPRARPADGVDQRGGAAPAGPPAGGFRGGVATGSSLPDGVTQAQFDAAQAACADQRPQRAGGAPGGVQASALRAYASCLADHGVEASTTAGTGPGGTGGAGAFPRINRDDPDFPAARAACAALEPSPAGATTTTTPAGAAAAG